MKSILCFWHKHLPMMLQCPLDFTMTDVDLLSVLLLSTFEYHVTLIQNRNMKLRDHQ